MGIQAPRAVVMIRPHGFFPNPQTRADNAFQSAPGRSATDIARAAYDEVSAAASALRSAGIAVHLFEDEDAGRPDSVFPNNWFSTHAGGHVAVFPMHAPNRRSERRSDVIEFLKTHYRVQQVVDYSGMEQDGIFLEGTGAMVLDHGSRIAYTARSRRADPVLLERFCTMFGYEPMAFDAVDPRGVPIYHTNVMMMIGSSFALVGLDAIGDRVRREEIAARLSAAGSRKVIPLTPAQVSAFAGNAIELDAGTHRILALSTRAEAALDVRQRALIEESCEIVSFAVPTIEAAGGSARCMIAGIHLDPRD